MGQGEEGSIAGGPGAATGATEPLQERGQGGGRVHLDDPVEVTDVDAEFEGRSRDDDAIAKLTHP